MCFAKAVVTRDATVVLEVADVMQVVTEGVAVRIITLYGEEHLLAGARVMRVDLGAGVIDITEG